MTVAPIEAIAALAGADPAQGRTPMAAPQTGEIQSFAQMLLGGVGEVNQKLVDAEAMAARFAVDDSVPLHQVTYALEQARLSFEFMLQVRARLVEGYQDIMRMQI